MTTEELIAKLTELEEATGGPNVIWTKVAGVYDLLEGNGYGVDGLDGDEDVADLVVLLKNEALPALEALAAENAELREQMVAHLPESILGPIALHSLSREQRATATYEEYREFTGKLFSENQDLRARLSEATDLLEAVSAATEREWAEKHPAMSYVTVQIDGYQREGMRAFLAPQKEENSD